MEQEQIQKIDEEYARDISCIVNAIAYEIYKDKTEVTINDKGVGQIWIEEEELIPIKRAALRVIREMITVGWTKAPQ